MRSAKNLFHVCDTIIIAIVITITITITVTITTTIIIIIRVGSFNVTESPVVAQSVVSH